MIARKFIYCHICGKHLKIMTHSHLKFHNLSFSEYIKKFPDANSVSIALSEIMTNSRQKFLEQGTFVAPMKLKSFEERKIIGRKVSICTKNAMNNPIVRLKISRNRKNGYGSPWNKGLTIQDERIKRATEKRAKTLENKPKNLIFISKIENLFFQELELKTGIKIHRQKRIKTEEGIRNVDGFIHTYLCDIIIEIDGVYWHNLPGRKQLDLALDDFCSRNKIQIFRFRDIDIYKKDFRDSYINKIQKFFDYACDIFEEKEFNMKREYA